MTYYVYIYRDPSLCGQPFYIGKGTGRRWRDHLRGNGSNRFMQARLKKMWASGISPEVEIVPAIDEAHAFFLEETLVDCLGRRVHGNGPLLNFSDGGRGGAKGVKRSIETRKKMSAARIGVSRPHSPETRAQMRITHTGMPGPNKGRIFGPRPRLTCLSCKKEGAINIMKPLHLDQVCIRREN